MFRIPRLRCHVILILCTPFTQLEGAVLSSSSLESCIRDSSQGEDLQCDEKLVLTVSLGREQALATEKLQLDLRCIGSPTGQCPCPCNYEADPGCSCRDVETPIKIWLTKSPVFASYPLEYIESYNYKPVEVIVRPDDNKCKADDYDSEPTCGWYRVGGKRQQDSQGFTCTCSSQQVWDHTFTGSNKRTRASLNCDFFTDPLDILLGNRPCSAHCLTFDPLWYSGYRIGSSALQFEITAHISVEEPPGNSTAAEGSAATVDGSKFPNEELKLSPSVPLAVSDSKLASMRLLGDLATYKQTTVLSSFMLLIPQPDGANLEDIRGSERDGWLLLDRSYISSDGSTCNKVGTSFSAFRYQTDGCFRAPQVCLQNQIKDLIAEDKERVKQGKVPQHLVTRYTYGSDSLLESFGGGPLSFAIPLSSESTSLVTISASADNVRLVINRSPGEIGSVRLCTFQSERCGGFEAGASRGYIWANLTNTGSVTAAYTLTVSNCSVNIRPIEAREVALKPGVPYIVRPPLELFVEDNQAEIDRHCWVDLYDSQGQITDNKRLGFFTNATEFEEQPEGGFKGEGDGPGSGAKRERDCDKVCSNAFDAACFVVNGCWGEFGSFLGILAGIGIGLALLGVLIKTGMLSRAGLAITNCLSSGGGGRYTKRQRQKGSYNYAPQGTPSAQGYQAAAPLYKSKGHEHSQPQQSNLHYSYPSGYIDPEAPPHFLPMKSIKPKLGLPQPHPPPIAPLPLLLSNNPAHSVAHSPRHYYLERNTQPGSAARAGSTGRVGRQLQVETSHAQRHHSKSTRQAQSLSPPPMGNYSRHPTSVMQPSRQPSWPEAMHQSLPSRQPSSVQQSALSRQPSWPEVLDCRRGARSQRTISGEYREDGRGDHKLAGSRGRILINARSPAKGQNDLASVSSSIAKVAAWQCHGGVPEIQGPGPSPQASRAPDRNPLAGSAGLHDGTAKRPRAEQTSEGSLDAQSGNDHAPSVWHSSKKKQLGSPERSMRQGPCNIHSTGRLPQESELCLPRSYHGRQHQHQQQQWPGMHRNPLFDGV